MLDLTTKKRKPILPGPRKNQTNKFLNQALVSIYRFKKHLGGTLHIPSFSWPALVKTTWPYSKPIRGILETTQE